MRRLPVLLVVPLLALVACKDKPKFIPPQDAGPLCDGNTQLVNGECRFVCQRDGDCMAAERCNLFLGQCEPKPPPPDAGPPPGNCTTGAIRCSADKKAIETCTADPPLWQVSTTCPPPGGFCQNERCLVCQPGAAQCVTGMPTELSVCLDDGSATRTVTCSGAASCQANECRECAPNTYRCNPANTGLQQCQKTADETATWKWTNVGDNFDGACITGQCRVGGANGYECVPPACFPGQIQCRTASTAQTCSMTGAWVDAPCTAQQECQAGVCVDECADAVAAKSYFGCEYWTAVQDNGALSPFQKGLASSSSPQQGTADSMFEFVVANRSVSAASVEVFRYIGGAETRLKIVTVPGRNDPSTKGILRIPVPWQSIAPSNVAPYSADPLAANYNFSITGQLRYAYRLVSTKPITVYQFNPLDFFKETARSCTATSGQPDLNCNEQGAPCDFFDSTNCGVCEVNGAGARRCRYYTYSNDASLLLPAHALGSSYVAVTQEHSNIYTNGNVARDVLSGHITIVSPQDGTQVTVRSSALTTASPSAAFGNIASMAKGEVRTFTMNKYDVLQLSSAAIAGAAGQIECTAAGLGEKFCRVDNDLTGTVVTATVNDGGTQVPAAVAVFGGSSCTLKPYNKCCCDHVEEQIFPFSTWGKSFVAVSSAPPLTQSGVPLASTLQAPDHFKIVASCPQTNPMCMNGTTITLSTPPLAADVMLPNRCLAGTSLQANNCRLAGGATMEFRSKTNFTITADFPIAVGQFFPGQTAHNSTTVVTGDPSLVLLPPSEQWRANYTVLTPQTIRTNFLVLSYDRTKVASISVDGAIVGGFTNVGITNFMAKNHPVTTGVHTITVTPLAGVTSLAGAGVTIYGYDSYVSYGYTGGLDLQSIVTGINPGG